MFIGTHWDSWEAKELTDAHLRLTVAKWDTKRLRENNSKGFQSSNFGSSQALEFNDLKKS